MNVCLVSQYDFSEDVTTGIGKVTWNLAQNLRKLKLNVDVIHDYGNNVKSFKDSLVFEYYTAPKKVIHTNYDCYNALSPSFAVPLFLTNKKPRIIHVQDIIPLIYDEAHIISRLHFRWTMFLAKKGDAIITISESVKNDLINNLKFDPDKINVTYLGVDHDLFKPRKAEPEKNIIGYVGALGKRKNVGLIIRAFYKLTKNMNVKAKLYILGRGPQKQSLIELVRRLNIGDDVKFFDFIPESGMPGFYSRLKLFVLPSLAEGFGLPIVEAMACGTPVITSNISSMPEISGGAAVTINPYSVDELAEAMNEVLSDDSYRRSVIKKGLKRADFFDWKKTAKQTFSVYKQVIDIE